MNFETVYQVAKALPKEEQILLFEKLKNDFYHPKKKLNNGNKILKKEDAIHYLLTTIFSNKVKVLDINNM
ncbi:hypothetical protein [uncultured Polaribacter sp.]|uniref:hypothetical protein n=1 Tax=uncultured Polaribacter sp. TaxID=174711 RepID=UPI0030DB4C23|tara:strand:+ start:773 stop:982 length:210 start_codon:yes stop_codon:yes gene_type:complete